MVNKKGAARKKRGISPDQERFGAHLRELRIKHGMTQADVAGNRYSAAYVSTIESGRRHPSQAAVDYFAQQLDVEPEELWSDAPSKWVEEMARELRFGAGTSEARRLMERSLAILESAGRVESRVVGIVHRELGLFAMERGELETAEKHLREAVRYLETDNSTPTIDLAITYYELGRLAEQRRDLQRAVEVYRAAAALLVERPLTPRAHPRKEEASGTGNLFSV